MRRFPPPWTLEQIPGGYKVKDANGQSLAYVYGRETKADADIAKVLTMDEAKAYCGEREAARIVGSRQITQDFGPLHSRTVSSLMTKIVVEHQEARLPEMTRRTAASSTSESISWGKRWP